MLFRHVTSFLKSWGGGAESSKISQQAQKKLQRQLPKIMKILILGEGGGVA